MKSVLIVGAGFGQLPGIKKAKELGFYTICIDRDPKAVGMALADKSYVVDVVDFDEALNIAENHNVSGLMTLQSDLPVPTIGYVNDRLGLNGVCHRVAEWCSNKIETRKRLEDSECEQPRFSIVRNITEARKAVKDIGLPCVIKAPDNSGSRGVVKVNQIIELEKALNEARSNSRGDKILIEEYVDGLEFGAQTFSVFGTCELVVLHNDKLSDPPYMIPIGHSMPFKYLTESEQKVVINDIKKAVIALGIENGPANVDLILDTVTKKVKIIEIGARIGATCLPELTAYHTGVDWVKEALKCAVGETVNLKIEKEMPVAALILESPDDGIFEQVNKVKTLNNPNIIEYEITVKNGENVNKLRKGTDRIGKVITTGSNVIDAEKLAEEFRKQLNIIVK